MPVHIPATNTYHWHKKNGAVNRIEHNYNTKFVIWHENIKLNIFLDRLGTSPCYAHGLTTNIKHKFYTMCNDNFHFTESCTNAGTVGKENSIQGVNTLYNGYSNELFDLLHNPTHALFSL